MVNILNSIQKEKENFMTLLKADYYMKENFQVGKKTEKGKNMIFLIK